MAWSCSWAPTARCGSSGSINKTQEERHRVKDTKLYLVIALVGRKWQKVSEKEISRGEAAAIVHEQWKLKRLARAVPVQSEPRVAA